MANKLRVGILMGGISAEREVSLNTGRQIAEILKDSDYIIKTIDIECKHDIFSKLNDIDIAFLALHGTFGEDGTIQGALETMGIPYTGCGVLSSAVAMDKDMTKRLLKANGVHMADWMIVKSAECIDFDKVHKLGWPLFVKPNSSGSSVATVKVDNDDKIKDAVIEALKYDSEVMIESFIDGDEITCPILDGKMLPTLIIKPRHGDFFDYNSKYNDGGADEIPIELPADINEKTIYATMKTWHELKMQVYARMDFIISDGTPYFLEVNTLPGMTKNSLFPKSAKAAGISFSELISSIIELSLKVNR